MPCLASPSEFSTLPQQAGENAPRKAALDLLRTRSGSEEPDHRAGSFTFIDLFAGIGGLRRGFEAIRGRCIFTCEKDRYCQQTYRANFPGDKHAMAGDIRDAIKARMIPDHDVLLAGFPCQPFSIAGVSKKNALKRPHGFACEAQGTLFYDLAEIIRSHQPRVFVLENVRNLLSHDKRRTFHVIHDVLQNQLGYHLSWRVIDARSWVPQHRERIFIVGFREPTGFTLDDLPIPSSLAGPKLGTILHQRGDPADKAFTRADGLPLEKYTLSEHLWSYLQGYAEKHRSKGNGFGFSSFGPDEVARTLSARYYKDGSEILIRQSGRPPRRLTPRECARLMGFDAPGQPPVRIPVSDTQAYRQFGNSVVVPVVDAVARHMEPFIRQAVGGTRRSNKLKDHGLRADRAHEHEAKEHDLPLVRQRRA